LLEVFWYTAAATFKAVFDRPLAPGVLDGPNWRFTTAAMNWHQGVAVAASAAQVNGTTRPSIFGPPVGTCQYEPPPFDLASKDGILATAFTAFPLTFMP